MGEGTALLQYHFSCLEIDLKPVIVEVVQLIGFEQLEQGIPFEAIAAINTLKIIDKLSHYYCCKIELPNL
jgi:hypothetical protein